MSRVHNFDLSWELREEAIRQLDDIPDDLIVKWGRDSLPGGFTKPNAIRNRMADMLRGAAPLAPRVFIFLQIFLLNRETVAALSANSLREMFRDMVLIFGREKILLALLFDPRQEVQQLAAEHFDDPSPVVTEQEVDVAQMRWFQFVEQRFFEGFEPLLEKSSQPKKQETASTAASEAEHQKLKAAIKKLEAGIDERDRKISRLKQEVQNERDRARTRLDAAAQNARSEKTRLRSEQEALRVQLTRVEKEKKETASQLEELRGQIDAAVAAGIAEQTGALVRKWLCPPLEAEQARNGTSGPAEELLERVEQALQAQTRQDRYTGNRLELAQKLKRLEEAREKLLGAAQTALRPVTEVRTVLAEVETEIGRLKKVLSVQGCTNELAARLLVSINHCSEWLDLRGYSSLAQSLAEHDLLNREERRAIYDAIHRKFSLVEERERPKDAEPDNGWALRSAIYRNRATHLLLDGHNILFRLTDLFASTYENDVPRKKSREKLIEIVCRLLDNRLNVHATICFDAPTHSAEQVSSNVTIEYSGGEGPHRADRLIASHLRFKEISALDEKRFVVTDDRQVRRAAISCGAKYVPNDLFAVLLSDFRCLS